MARWGRGAGTLYAHVWPVSAGRWTWRVVLQAGPVARTVSRGTAGSRRAAEQAARLRIQRLRATGAPNPRGYKKVTASLHGRMAEQVLAEVRRRGGDGKIITAPDGTRTVHVPIPTWKRLQRSRGGFTPLPNRNPLLPPFGILPNPRGWAKVGVYTPGEIGVIASILDAEGIKHRVRRVWDEGYELSVPTVHLRRAIAISARANPRRVRVTRGQYVRERVVDPRAFDPRSLRTVVRRGHRVVIGCPRGQWSVRRRRCKVGTRAQAILHPMRNPRFVTRPENTEVSVWEERDRLHIELRHRQTGKTIAEWWDDDARQMFEDGFFDRRRLKQSVIEYAQSVGLLSKGNPLRRRNPLTERERASLLHEADIEHRRGEIAVTPTRRAFFHGRADGLARAAQRNPLVVTDPAGHYPQIPGYEKAVVTGVLQQVLTWGALVIDGERYGYKASRYWAAGASTYRDLDSIARLVGRQVVAQVTRARPDAMWEVYGRRSIKLASKAPPTAPVPNPLVYFVVWVRGRGVVASYAYSRAGEIKAHKHAQRAGGEVRTVTVPEKGYRNPRRKYTIGRGPTEVRLTAAQAKRMMRANPLTAAEKQYLYEQGFVERLAARGHQARGRKAAAAFRFGRADVYTHLSHVPVGRAIGVPIHNPLTPGEVGEIASQADIDEAAQDRAYGTGHMQDYGYYRGRAVRGRQIIGAYKQPRARHNPAACNNPYHRHSVGNPLLQTVMFANAPRRRRRRTQVTRTMVQTVRRVTVSPNAGRSGTHPMFDPVIVNILRSQGYTMRGASIAVRMWRTGLSKHIAPRVVRDIRAAAKRAAYTRGGRNPLTRGEAAEVLWSARHDLGEAGRQKKVLHRGFFAGRATGKAIVAKLHGPEAAELAAQTLMGRGYRAGMRNPPRSVPWREGQRIPVAKARAWVVSTGDRELLRQFDAAHALQRKANRDPKHVVWHTVPIGGKRLQMVTAMAHYGDSPETYYVAPKGSKKGTSLYRHKWGEGGGRGSVPLLAAPGGKALLMPLKGRKHAGEWLQH